ncbi:stressosome-associated protein Prli42 [Caldalkalibacillus mannanilyticus]|nr:stressosome-associated protein Prli42 [Caldalkalibacillus mannanilyticus]
MLPKRLVKIVVYVMIGSLLVSTLLMGVGAFF